MAVETTDLSKRYNCNGANQDFPITFEYLDTAALLDVKLYSTSLGTYTTLALTTDYTVADDTVTTVATYATGYDILLRLDFTDLITQGTDWVENDKFTSGSWETALDRVTLICQWLAEGLSRAIQGPFADAASVDWVIGETAGERASGYLQFSADGLSIGVATGSVPSLATVTAFTETLLDDTSASAVLSTLGFSEYTISGRADPWGTAPYRGYMNAALASLADATQPQIVGLLEVNGTLVEFASLTSATGWSLLASGCDVWFAVTESANAYVTTSAPTWSNSLGGWYDGNDRYVAWMRRNVWLTSSYVYKHMLPTVPESPIRFEDVVNISVWNMDVDANLSVNWGFGNTSHIQVSIINDDKSILYPIDYSANASSATAGTYYHTSLQCILVRHSGGLFDSVDYDSSVASMNRGFIMVHHGPV